MKLFRLLSVLVTAITLSNCSSVPDVNAGNLTTVDLHGNNYKIIHPGAKGESSGFHFLGIPIKDPTAAEAKDNLYKSVGISAKGRAIALANQTQDRSKLNLIIFGIPKLTITGDVVEFTSGR